jgi:hypothetical protein
MSVALLTVSLVWGLVILVALVLSLFLASSIREWFLRRSVRKTIETKLKSGGMRMNLKEYLALIGKLPVSEKDRDLHEMLAVFKHTESSSEGAITGTFEVPKPSQPTALIYEGPITQVIDEGTGEPVMDLMEALRNSIASARSAHDIPRLSLIKKEIDDLEEELAEDL